MNPNERKTLMNLIREERGQAMIWVGTMMTAFLGVAGLVTDTGRTMIAYRQLQASTNAAVLAGAADMPNSNYVSVADDYASGTSGYNQIPLATNVKVSVNGACLGTVSGWGIGCQTPSGGTAAYNSLTVTQSADVPTIFARIFGVKQIPITATATAAMRGATPIPYNVAIIVDTTQSMNDQDSDSQCSTTRIACSLAGIVTMLQNMAGCTTSLTSCGTVTSVTGPPATGNVANPVNHVSLFTFPNVSQSTVANDYGCKGTNPTAETYTFPSTTATSYSPSSSTATYEVVGFSSDFKTAGTTTTLSSSSDLVKAVGGVKNCTAMAAEGGEGTYYAGVIYAAQAALVAEQAANPGSQNAIVMISDGDATEASKDLSSPGSSNTNGAYPSYIDECNQAAIAAQAATAAGTRVYAVAYGAESSGCTYTQTTGSGRSQKTTTVYEGADQSGYIANITPCQTMENIASNSAYFYSDYTSTSSGSTTDSSCIGTATSTTQLSQIFSEIANSMTTSRLIPNGTT